MRCCCFSSSQTQGRSCISFFFYYCFLLRGFGKEEGRGIEANSSSGMLARVMRGCQLRSGTWERGWTRAKCHATFRGKKLSRGRAHWAGHDPDATPFYQGLSLIFPHARTTIRTRLLSLPLEEKINLQMIGLLVQIRYELAGKI